MLDLILKKSTIPEVVVLLLLFFFFKKIFIVFFLSFLAYLFYLKWSLSKLPKSKAVTSSLMTSAFYSLQSDPMFTFGKCRIPSISSDQILVKVKAAAINPIDYLVIGGMIPFYRWFIDHHGIGFDFSGVVVDIGANVKRFKVGDEIFGRDRDGGIQEYTFCYEKDAVLKPKSISFAEAAALPLAGLTSLQAIQWWGPIEGKVILVIGASGGTGHFGVQQAKYLKAKTIVGVCSSKNSEFVRGLGADIVLEYDKPNYLNEIGDLRFDLIFDTVTSPTTKNQEEIYRKYLKPSGKYVAINGAGGDNTRGMIATNCKMLSFIERTDYHFHMLDYTQYKDLELLAKMAEEKKLVPTLNEFDFDKKGVISAFDLLLSRRTRGKIVIKIENDVDKKKQ